MNYKKSISFLALFILFLVLPLSAQTIKQEIFETVEKSGGVYYPYQYNKPTYTPAPRGYKPVYITHYARHGSRWMTKDAQYQKVLDEFEAADKNNALSEYGKDVYRRVQLIAADAIERHTGDLSPLGARQHAGIAERMYDNFPQVFKGKKAINTYSTIVPRCILSMHAFNQTIKGKNPKLAITAEANMRTSTYLNAQAYHPLINKEFKYIRDNKQAAWRKVQADFAQKELNPDRIMSLLFNGNAYAKDSIDGVNLMIILYHMASNLQNLDLDVSLYDVFEKEEMYYLWLIENYRFYASFGTSPLNKGYPVFYATALLEDIVERTDKALADKEVAADLRFGHDTSLMPFLSLIQMPNSYAVETDLVKIGDLWQSYKLSPMAGNIQFIFYEKKKSDKVLVKILHNEQEVALPLEADNYPYYDWKKLKQYFLERIDFQYQKMGYTQ